MNYNDVFINYITLQLVKLSWVKFLWSIPLSCTRIVSGRWSQQLMVVRSNRTGHARVEHDVWCLGRWLSLDCREWKARTEREHLRPLMHEWHLRHLGMTMSLNVIGICGWHAGLRHGARHTNWSGAHAYWIGWHGATASRHSSRTQHGWPHPGTVSWNPLSHPLHLLTFFQEQSLYFRKLLQFQLQPF